MSLVNNKRIFKNTMLLYTRMLLTMFVTFFTTRVILNVLGISDYGIYNTIAGVVVLFAFLNTAMVTTTQRFLNFYLGKGDKVSASKSFNLSFLVHVIIGITIVVLTEFVGLIFLNTKMSLPPERFDAALWTLHFSVFITFINTIRSPYHACIVAHERMDFYAYLSIVEVLAKLAIVYLLLFFDCDKLILYSFLLLIVSITTALCYKIYCNKHFSISRLRICWDKSLFKQLVGFSSFSILGNAANVGTQQGLNMMLNVFAGVIANAAAGIGNQLSHGVYSLCSNFQLAFNPQLVKSYASGAIDEVKKLICRMSKVSYFLMFIISLPLLLYTEDFLNFWLGDVPNYATEISQLTLLFLMVDSVAAPLWITVQASGDIKKYQIIICLLVISNLPISYTFLKIGYSPISIFVVRFIINILAYIFRYLYVRRLINFEFSFYTKQFIIPILKVTLVSFLISIFIKNINLHYMLGTILVMLVIAVSVILLGLSNSERSTILEYIKRNKKK